MSKVLFTLLYPSSGLPDIIDYDTQPHNNASFYRLQITLSNVLSFQIDQKATEGSLTSSSVSKISSPAPPREPLSLATFHLNINHKAAVPSKGRLSTNGPGNTENLISSCIPSFCSKGQWLWSETR